MKTSSSPFPAWLVQWMVMQEMALWGAADLRSFSTPRDPSGNPFPFAVSFALPMDPEIMSRIRTGPSQEYADAYARANERINEVSAALAAEIRKKGWRSLFLAASARTDPENIRGDFPQKTAATRAGLGWIGRHCQLITRRFGPWVRLGTVFTDMVLPCGPPMEKSFCGECRRCIDACPATALKGRAWFPGLPREEILDVRACDQWKKENYFHFHAGHVCGICSAVCPYGIKTLKKKHPSIFS